MFAIPTITKIAQRRLAEQFKPGDSAAIVLKRGYLYILLHRPTKGYRPITEAVSAALEWPMSGGYMVDARRFELVVGLAKAIPMLSEIEIIDTGVR